MVDGGSFSNKDELDSYKFNEFGNESPTTGAEIFEKQVSLKVSKETYDLWVEWMERMKIELGYDNPSKAFEFAIVEAMNTPVERWHEDEHN